MVYQDVSLPLEYTTQVLDKNHTGLISIQQIANDPLLLKFLPLPHSLLLTNNTKTITTTLAKDFGTSDYISIDKQLKPILTENYENITAVDPQKCNTLGVYPILWKSLSNMTPNLSIIGNASKSTGILILNGENDSQTLAQQAFLLQQKRNEVNHLDHMLITYPSLGRVFHPSSQRSTQIGPIQHNVLADIYAWLESHSGLSHSFEPATATNQMSPNITLIHLPPNHPLSTNDEWNIFIVKCNSNRKLLPHHVCLTSHKVHCISIFF